MIYIGQFDVTPEVWTKFLDIKCLCDALESSQHSIGDAVTARRQIHEAYGFLFSMFEEEIMSAGFKESRNDYIMYGIPYIGRRLVLWYVKGDAEIPKETVGFNS